MKKVISFISVLAACSAMVFADITAKKLDDGSVEATFFYGNPRASEVLLAGDFTSWQDGALQMEKGDKGFTLVKTFPKGTTVKYKFIVDGSWTTDLKAPDSIDDGFGGKNALAELDSLAGGAGGDAGKKPSIKFQTWSMVGFQSLWKLSVDKDKDNGGLGGSDQESDLDSTGIGAKSWWKFGGNITPHIPIFIELCLFEQDSFNNLYQNGKLRAKDGGKKAGTDIAFDPMYWLGGEQEKWAYLGQFKVGVETNWVNYYTGYRNAKLPLHQNANWTTVDGEWEAGYSGNGGYTQWGTGIGVSETIEQLTGGAISGFEAVIAPNRSADRAGKRYGSYSYLDMTVLDNHYIDFQYNAAYTDNYDTIFDHILENDYIIGYKGKFGDLTVKANGLLNYYGSIDNGEGKKTYYTPASSDVGMVDDDVENKLNDTAANINFAYAHDLFDLTVGFRYRGAQANMMYVEDNNDDDHEHIKDNLGKLNRYRAWFDINTYPTEFLSIGVNPYIEKAFDTDYDKIDDTFFKAHKTFNNKDTTLVYVKPYGEIDLNDILYMDAKLSFYAETKYVTKEEDEFLNGGLKDSKNFILEEAGLRFETKLDGALSPAAIMYGYDANDDQAALHTVIAELGLPLGINAQLGCGIYTADNKVIDQNPFGFFVGMNKQICKSYNTVFYTHFVYNMDPYKEFGDGQDTLNLDEYTLDSDVDYFWSKAAFRAAFKFDF
ncbi:MAG: glycogen-binding domain-containing protein [Treponema sp.]|nr:glycogen-binding domain-containing protein [Treponema sp.]